MSAIIVTLLLVMLSIVLVGVVWAVINNMISKQVTQTGSCFGSLNSVTINQQYTCYNSSAKKVQFSLNVGDVDLNGIVVSIASPAGSVPITLTNTSSTIPGVTNYSGGSSVKIPGKNAGQTYFYTWSSTTPPDSMTVAPIMGQTTCSKSDELSTISDCTQLY